LCIVVVVVVVVVNGMVWDSAAAGGNGGRCRCHHKETGRREALVGKNVAASMRECGETGDRSSCDMVEGALWNDEGSCRRED